jgi:hypothetical protein
MKTFFIHMHSSFARPEQIRRACLTLVLLAATTCGTHAQKAAPQGAPDTVPPLAPVAPTAAPASVPGLPGLPPAPSLTPPAPTPKRSADRAPRLDDAIIAEETNADPSAAAEQYRTIIARFDSQRSDAAQAVFRLAECLRKLGRIEEASVHYARILREFLDQGELVKLSQKRLSDLAPSGGNRRTSASSGVRESVDDLLAKEMALVREQVSEVEKRVANGIDSNAALLPLRRELLRLEQERAIRAEPATANSAAAPSTVRSNTLTATEEELRGINAECRKQQLELQKLSAIKAMVEKGSAEKLTARIIDNPRFQELKAEYEKLLTTAADGGPGAKEAAENLEQARRKLETWVAGIYIPELSSSIEFAENQMDRLWKMRAELEKKIEREAAELKLKTEPLGASRGQAR